MDIPIRDLLGSGTDGYKGYSELVYNWIVEF